MKLDARHSTGLFFIAFVIVLILRPASLQGAPISFANAVLADSPLAYWRLNELSLASPALDISGNGNNGTYSTTGISLGQAGLGGGDTEALFDGLGSGRIVVPNNFFTLNPPHITLEALLSWNGPIGFQQRIIEKSRFAGGQLSEYGLSILPDGSLIFEIQVGITQSEMFSVGFVQPGVATDVAATYDGLTMRIYINGVLDNSQAPVLAGPIPLDLTNLSIGNQIDRDRAFNGILDEVALYGTVLSGDQLRTHLAAVPEPSTLMLLSTGLLAMLGLLVRRTKFTQM
jgi:hypothetical protein